MLGDYTTWVIWNGIIQTVWLGIWLYDRRENRNDK